MRTDFEIQQDIMNELKWQPFLKAANIGVSVNKGIVGLSGHVENYAQKVQAEKAVKKVLGVRAIAEDIQVGIKPVIEKSDGEIAETVLFALKWHSAVPEEKMKVKVEKGVVTLEGEVLWDYQRSSAKNAVINLLGVKNVINLITVKPRPTGTDIKEKINAAFQRAASIDSERMNVDVKEGNVVLRGKVRSFVEKEEAEEAAWCAPGVVRVENHLEIEPEIEFVF